MQLLIANQFTIAGAATVGGTYRAVLHCQTVRGNAEALRCEPGENFADLRRRMLDGGAAVLHRMAAGGIAFVRGELCIGRNERDPADIDGQFFGGDLYERGFYALPQFRLARKYGDVARAVDAYPGIEHRLILEAAGKRPFRRRGRGIAVVFLCAQ